MHQGAGRQITHAAQPDGPRRLLRQLFARLLAHHVLGVPIWPVRVGLPDALLVLAVRGGGAPKCARQVIPRRKGRRRGVDTTGQPLRDFLQQPAVAVRICEGNEGAVAEMVGLWAADADADALKSAGGSFSTVKDLACVDALRRVAGAQPRCRRPRGALLAPNRARPM